MLSTAAKTKSMSENRKVNGGESRTENDALVCWTENASGNERFRVEDEEKWVGGHVSSIYWQRHFIFFLKSNIKTRSSGELSSG